MACLIINLYCNFLCTAFDQEIRKSVVIIDIKKVVLAVKITCLFRTEGISKKINEQILCRAA